MRCDPHSALIGLLLVRGGPCCRLVSSGERPWASITFEGARHTIELQLPTEATALFLAGIEEAEFDLPCHLLADLAVTDDRPVPEGLSALRIEALTLLLR